MEGIKAVKFITAIILAVTLSLSLVIACPSFSITSDAAESNSNVWSVSAGSKTLESLYNGGSSRVMQYTLDGRFIKGTISQINVSEIVAENKILKIEYPSFDYTMTIYSNGTSSQTLEQFKQIFSGLHPCLTDDHGLIYNLDAANGGSIVIEDCSDLTTLSFVFRGLASGTLTFSRSTSIINSVVVLPSIDFTITALDKTVPLPPEPTNPPVNTDDLLDLGAVKIGEDENGNLVKEGTVYVPGGELIYETKNVDFVSNAEPTGLDYVRHAVIEDYCPKFIGRFTLNVDVDGYVSLQFPDLFLFPERVKPDEYVPLDADKVIFPTGSGLAEIGLLEEWAEPMVVLYADGKKYYVSPYGGNVRIPVNKGENVVLMEIGLQVKDEFLSNHEGYVQSVYQCYLEDFAVYIREYQDSNAAAMLDEIKKANEELKKQTEEQKKQTDALTKYENADKMDSDNDKLTGAIGDYNDVSDSIFESAGGGIGNFDVSTGFEFSDKLLTSIGFVGTIMTSIISAMGDFSILYTLGVCLVLVCVLIGLYKYFSGGGDKD